MKITEGYWLQSEKANTLYAVEAYEIKAIPKGLSVLATTRKVRERGDTLNLPTINVWFTSPLPNIIRVEARHFMGYQVHTAQFQLFETNEDVDIQITDTYAIMKTGEVSIKIYKGEWNYEFIVGGEILTTNSLKNLGYVRYGKDATTMAPGPEYMIEDYLPYMVNELSL